MGTRKYAWIASTAELVDRGTYPVQLTPAGRTFCEESREALAGLMRLRSSLREVERMPGRSIQVTAGHSLSMTFLPKWLKQFQRLAGMNGVPGWRSARIAPSATRTRPCANCGRCWRAPRAPCPTEPSERGSAASRQAHDGVAAAGTLA